MPEQEWICRYPNSGIMIPIKELVRCKECYFKRKQGSYGTVVCNLDGSQHDGNWYCPKGERSLTEDG